MQRSVYFRMKLDLEEGRKEGIKMERREATAKPVDVEARIHWVQANMIYHPNKLNSFFLHDKAFRRVLLFSPSCFWTI